MTLLRYLDLVLLAVALPVFVLGGLPLIGYAAAAAAWLVQRAIQTQTDWRARKSEDPRTMAGLLAGSMLARGWMVALVVFGVGMAADREDGLAAAVLCIALFTVYFSVTMMTRPLATERRPGVAAGPQPERWSGEHATSASRPSTARSTSETPPS